MTGYRKLIMLKNSFFILIDLWLIIPLRYRELSFFQNTLQTFPKQLPPKTGLRNLNQRVGLYRIREDLDCVHWCKRKNIPPTSTSGERLLERIIGVIIITIESYTE